MINFVSQHLRQCYTSIFSFGDHFALTVVWYIFSNFDTGQHGKWLCDIFSDYLGLFWKERSFKDLYNCKVVIFYRKVSVTPGLFMPSYFQVELWHVLSTCNK